MGGGENGLAGGLGNKSSLAPPNRPLHGSLDMGSGEGTGSPSCEGKRLPTRSEPTHQSAVPCLLVQPDAQCLQELLVLFGEIGVQILVREFGRAAVICIVLPLVESDRRFQDEQYVVTLFTNLPNYVRNRLRLGQRFVDRAAQALDQLLESLLHVLRFYTGGPRHAAVQRGWLRDLSEKLSAT